jgi:4-methyl-5(b-hydroxyethyl)-thiazole monophosphate biosynthesis
MAQKALVLLAEGFEEVEALTPVDYLRRAGIGVSIAAIGEKPAVTGARGIAVNADTLLGNHLDWKSAAASWDAVILPGGMPGASNLAASPETGMLLKEMAAAGKWICAICASPAVVLAPLGLLAGFTYTCYPGMEKDVSGASWSDERVVVSPRGRGGLITSRGAGTAGLFAVAIIENLLDRAAGRKIAESVLL